MCIKSYKMEGNNLSTVNGNVDNNEKFVLLELGVGEDGVFYDVAESDPPFCQRKKSE